MAISEESLARFMQSKDRARKLIQMDANGEMDAVTESAKRSGKLSYDSNGVNTTINEHSVTKEMPNYSNIQQVAMNNTKSKLPKEILESFANNNIDTSMLGVGVGQSSVLDQIDKLTGGGMFEQHEQPKRVITETAPQYNAVSSSSSVDYSMIKMIVEDCMKKYTSALKKSILNESKTATNENNLQVMKIGDKFSFVDGNGNLYEAKLTFIKNIREQKKRG